MTMINQDESLKKSEKASEVIGTSDEGPVSFNTGGQQEDSGVSLSGKKLNKALENYMSRFLWINSFNDYSNKAKLFFKKTTESNDF